MKFEAKAVDIDLTLTSLDGETRTYYPRERPSANFADQIFDEIEKYQEGQRALPEGEKGDRQVVFYSKGLFWIYKDLDIKWVQKNFTAQELKEIFGTIIDTLLGVKKDGEN